MAVSTYLELYLTLFGWLMYDRFWDIIMETGLGYFPFIAVFVKNIAAPIKSQEAKDAASTSLRRIEIDLFAMFTVVVIAVQPLLTIKYTGLSYTLACKNGQTSGQKFTAGNTGTTYDTSFTQAALGGVDPKIPLWWYALLSVTGGFNDAAVMAIPCTTDIRLLTTKLENSRVKDPQLRRQVQLFYNDCYLEAMQIFLDKNLTYPNNLPKDDIYWLGSQYFLSGLYKTRQASTEIPGFPYDKNRDLRYDPRVYIPKYGRPTCAQWWTGQGNENGLGLKDALADQIDDVTLDDYLNAASNVSGKPQDEIKNIAIRSLISREKTQFNGLRDLNMYNDVSLANMASSVAATAGAILESASFYPAMYMMKAAAPIIQAVVLMLIYMLMPFYFWFSSYDIGKVIFMSIIVFSVKFWTVLWAVANWLDNNLIAALSPNWWQMTLQNNLVVELVINFVTAGMFVVVPLFWSGLLGWAGFRVGSELSKFANETRSTPGSAGSKGGDFGKDKISGGKF
jgi:TraG-like protein, N-terminal region